MDQISTDDVILRKDAHMSRMLLCFHSGDMPDCLCEELQEAGWVPTLVTDLAQTISHIQKGSHLVGLLFIDRLNSQRASKLIDVLKKGYAIEWVGVFSKSALKTGQCTELILGYLFDHYTSPLDIPMLLHSLGHAFGRATLRQEGWLTIAPSLDGHEPKKIIGNSPATKLLIGTIRKVANTNAPVLIRGESGSGKELAAFAIHQFSRRSTMPFIAVNCGAISSNLIHAELFGVVRGAFTGAAKDRKGLLEAAHLGTIFLDEVADLPIELQTNLLRFLQEKIVTPVGATHSVPVDARVVAATNVDLHTAVKEGRFREDLMYRLNVISLPVPPLRERPEDILLLARYYFNFFAEERASQVRDFSHSAMMALLAHCWPGNIRELINRVRRAIVLCEGRLITPEDLELNGLTAPLPETLDKTRIVSDRNTLYQALLRNGGNVTHTARALSISRMTLYRMIQRYKIDLQNTKLIGRPKATAFVE